MKKQSKDVVYLIGDFRAATVFVGKGLFYSAAEKPEDLAKPVHDVDLNGRTYRFWNADPKFHKALAERPNTYLFAGDLNGLLLQVENNGMITARHYPELMRALD